MKTALIHGFGTSGRVWRRVLAALDGEARIPELLAPDLMGFGDAAGRGRAGQTTGDMAAALGATLRTQGGQGGGPWHLVGHSMGAKVALLLAARQPELVAGLLLVAPSPPGPEPMTDTGRAQLRAAHGDAAALRAQYSTISRQPLDPADLEALVQDGLRASADAWIAWTDVGSREDLRAEVADLNVPITVLASADDPVITPDTVQSKVLAALPGARLVQMAGSGHLIPLEDPAAVAALLH